MRARLLFVGLLAIALPALAQPKPPSNPNQQALELAQRLGREWSVEGLETIVQSRNVDLVAAYERGFRESASKAPPEQPQSVRLIPPSIEAIIVRHYGDPQLGPQLRELVSASRAQYRTRELFDLMYAEWRSGKPRPSTYPIRDAILRTDLAGIEAPLLEFLQAMDRPESEDGNAIVRFLAQRKYSPAVPVMIAIQRKAAPGTAFTVSQALLDTRAPAAIAAAIQRLVWLKSQPAASQVASEAAFLTNAIAGLPAEVPVDYAAFRKALPQTLEEGHKSAVLSFIAKRKEKQGADEALRLLSEPRHHSGALNTLVDLDSPEIWKRARAEVELLKGILNDGQYRYASTLLDDKIAAPEKHFAEQKRLERQKDFDAKKSALYAQRNAARQLRDSNPDDYLNGIVAYLKAQESLVKEYPELPHAAVGLRGDIANDYFNLGHFARFRMKRATQAIELYEAARASGNGLGALAVADTYQFDLRDKAQALARYRALLEEQRRAAQPGNELEAAISQFMKAWLGHQADYLASGKTFSGPLRQEECGLVPVLVHYGPGAAQDDYLDLPLASEKMDRNSIGRRLEALPASAFTLLRTAAFVSALPSADAILSYLKKHDPAGFASACFFALPDPMLPRLVAVPPGQPDPVRVAATRFNKEHGIVAPKPDPRMASPDQTWQLFIGSLRKGDAETALSCLTSALQQRLRPALGGQPPEKLRAMAEALAGRKEAGMITFIDVGGAWKIGAL